jgi:phosphoribosylformimino-5-aminoimidazole carboxamide ribonucleotide (ProFAR) isomerase
VGIEVIPAIDISEGRLARPAAGGVTRVDGAFGGDPLAAARTFVDAGARWLHVVDLDLAATGSAINAGVLQRIARGSARVQASGGVRSRDDVDTLLAAGASRVVLGSAALADIDEVSRIVADYRDRLAIGLEVDGGRVRSRGHARVDLPLEEAMDELAALAPPRVIVTALGRVGRLAGPDVATLARVAERLQCPIVAAGGIGSIADLDLVRSLDGVEAAIVGRAAQESRLDVRAAIAAGR